MFTDTAKTFCPYCGEPIELVLDPGAQLQTYTEDCQVCCRPMIVEVFFQDEEPHISVRTEDE